MIFYKFQPITSVRAYHKHPRKVFSKYTKNKRLKHFFSLLMAFGQKSVNLNHVRFFPFFFLFLFFPSLPISNSKDFQFSLQEALFESQICNLLIPHFSRQFWMSKGPKSTTLHATNYSHNYNPNPPFPKREKTVEAKTAYILQIFLWRNCFSKKNYFSVDLTMTISFHQSQCTDPHPPPRC